MSVVNSGLGDCSNWWTDVLNPSCWLTDPMGIKPSLAVVQASCTSGTTQQQADCKAGVKQAQDVANADPDYACAMSDWQLACMTGLTDPNGNPNAIPPWLYVVGAVVVGSVVLGAIHR